jgi:hypothetical protein
MKKRIKGMSRNQLQETFASIKARGDVGVLQIDHLIFQVPDH